MITTSSLPATECHFSVQLIFGVDMHCVCVCVLNSVHTFLHRSILICTPTAGRTPQGQCYCGINVGPFSLSVVHK